MPPHSTMHGWRKLPPFGRVRCVRLTWKALCNTGRAWIDKGPRLARGILTLCAKHDPCVLPPPRSLGLRRSTGVATNVRLPRTSRGHPSSRTSSEPRQLFLERREVGQRHFVVCHERNLCFGNWIWHNIDPIQLDWIVNPIGRLETRPPTRLPFLSLVPPPSAAGEGWDFGRSR